MRNRINERVVLQGTHKLEKRGEGCCKAKKTDLHGLELYFQIRFRSDYFLFFEVPISRDGSSWPYDPAAS